MRRYDAANTTLVNSAVAGRCRRKNGHKCISALFSIATHRCTSQYRQSATSSKFGCLKFSMEMSRG